ncbi:unnamed protein product [Nesidiocoris tenuis]|uniref:Carboxypeptidase n=1 Tax=Nesidiocoris tenuis TaxID=355587 RepID=A0A6H5FV75_9HEMI|nr:unnamed protein product [Nesidiocoris tenuis]
MGLSLLLLGIICASVHISTTSPIADSASNTGKPLFLTPYVEEGRFIEARTASRVPSLPGAPTVESYSGYLTVNKEYNSNLFFWFFPAENNRQKAPFALWLQGGPGGSSLYGTFAENGPFSINEDDLTLTQGKHYWSQELNMIYIDSPVGTGFSFTQYEEGFATNETRVGADLYSALVQFFQLFPEYKKNKFFITGESYAGKYIPALAHTIHVNNPSADLKINLVGFAIGDGWIDPRNMMVYSEYLLQHGIVDENTAAAMKIHEKNATALIDQKKFHEATEEWHKVVGLFEAATGAYQNMEVLCVIWFQVFRVAAGEYLRCNHVLPTNTAQNSQISLGEHRFICSLAANIQGHRRLRFQEVTWYRGSQNGLLPDLSYGYRIGPGVTVIFAGNERLEKIGRETKRSDFSGGRIRRMIPLLFPESTIRIHFVHSFPKTANDFFVGIFIKNRAFGQGQPRFSCQAKTGSSCIETAMVESEHRAARCLSTRADATCSSSSRITQPCERLPYPNVLRDILPSPTRSWARRDTTLQIGTVPPNAGRLVTLIILPNQYDLFVPEWMNEPTRSHTGSMEIYFKNPIFSLSSASFERILNSFDIKGSAIHNLGRASFIWILVDHYAPGELFGHQLAREGPPILKLRQGVDTGLNPVRVHSHSFIRACSCSAPRTASTPDQASPRISLPPVFKIITDDSAESWILQILRKGSFFVSFLNQCKMKCFTIIEAQLSLSGLKMTTKTEAPGEAIKTRSTCCAVSDMESFKAHNWPCEFRKCRSSPGSTTIAFIFMSDDRSNLGTIDRNHNFRGPNSRFLASDRSTDPDPSVLFHCEFDFEFDVEFDFLFYCELEFRFYCDFDFVLDFEFLFHYEFNFNFDNEFEFRFHCEFDIEFDYEFQFLFHCGIPSSSS